MADTKIEASRSIYYSITDDVPGLTEQEKEKLEAVMKKAQEFEEEEAIKMRQPIEGQLYKYTNVMKGWQYRWFVLTPDTGLLEYYVGNSSRSSELVNAPLDERKKGRPRGALHLAGASVTPGEEDNQSFTVSAVCGEVFKLKASNSKERQFWIDRIRTVIEKCSTEESVALKADAIQPTFALCKSLSSSSNSTFHVVDDKVPGSPIQVVSEKNLSTLSEHSLSEKSLGRLNDIKENVYKAVTCQKTLAKSIEDLPFSGPSIKCSDRKLLLIKATSQATVQSLEQCFLILQRIKQREMSPGVATVMASPSEPLDKAKPYVKKQG